MCDICDYVKIVHPKYNFCPECGAKIIKNKKENIEDEINEGVMNDIKMEDITMEGVFLKKC